MFLPMGTPLRTRSRLTLRPLPATSAQVTAAPEEAALPTTTDWECARLLNIRKNQNMQKLIMSSPAAAVNARPVIMMEPGPAVVEGAVTQPHTAQADPEQEAGRGLKRPKKPPGEATGEQEWAAPKSRRRKQESAAIATATLVASTSSALGGGGGVGGVLFLGAAAGTGLGTSEGVAGEPTGPLRRAKAVIDYNEGTSDSD